MTGSKGEAGPAPFEPLLDPGAVAEMRARLHAARWPEPVKGAGWDWGVDLGYLRSLCAWWADEYDPAGLIERLSELPGFRHRGIHFLHGRTPAPKPGPAILMIHGWPGAPLDFRHLAPLLLEAGHDVVVPSLPGFGFSDANDPPASATVIADQLVELMATLGYGRFVVHGGDWGGFIGARIAFGHPRSVAGFHCNAPGLLPLPPDLGDPPLSEAEIAFVQDAQRWRSRRGFHMLVHGLAPDTLGVGLGDSPAALAAWLIPRYREWSDCDGDLESRFSRRDLCDLLSFYWTTGTAASALRLYAASRIDRWQLQPGELIEVPVAVADFPAELVRPPRSWTERICADLRSWNEFERGGHFAAWEEPETLAADLLDFVAGL